MKRTGYFVALMTAMLVLTSCSSLLFEAKDKSAGEQTQQSSGEAQELFIYTLLAQYLSDKLEPSLLYYVEKYGATETLSVSDEQLGWTNSIFLELGHYTSVLEGASASLPNKDSFHALDEAADNMLPIVKALSSKLSEADVYYKTKGYVDDDLVKGKELHASLIANIAEAVPLMEQFYTSYYDTLLQFYEHKLAVHNDQNEPVRAASVSILMHAIEFNNLVPKNGIYIKEEQLAVDNEGITATYQQLAEQVALFLELGKDSNQLELEKLDSSFAYSSNFQMYMTKMKAGATDIQLYFKNNATTELTSKEYKDLYKFYQYTFYLSLVQYWVAFEEVES